MCTYTYLSIYLSIHLSIDLSICIYVYTYMYRISFEVLEIQPYFVAEDDGAHCVKLQRERPRCRPDQHSKDSKSSTSE